MKNKFLVHLLLFCSVFCLATTGCELSSAGSSKSQTESDNKDKDKDKDKDKEKDKDKKKKDKDKNKGKTGQEDAYPDFNTYDIESASLTFYAGYNIATAEYLNASGEYNLPKYTIELDASQIEELQTALAESEAYDMSDTWTEYIDYVNITINDSLVLSSDGWEGVWLASPFTEYRSDDVISLINGWVQEYMEENEYIYLWDNELDYILNNGNMIEPDSRQLSDLEKYHFTKVGIETDYEEYGEVEDVLVFKDGSALLLFEDNSHFGYLDGVDYGFYVYIDIPDSTSLIHYISLMANGIETPATTAVDSDTITISYDGESYSADDTLIESINAESKTITYSQYDWLDLDYDRGDCVSIETANGTFYIPTNTGYFNRYFISNDGEIYMSDPFSTDIEIQIFETAGLSR